MITKQLLEDVESWQVTVETGYFNGVDIYTLHFHQWWRRKRVIRVARIISNIDKVNNTFTHGQSSQSEWLYQRLCAHVDASFIDPDYVPPVPPEVEKKDNVFHVDFSQKKDDEEEDKDDDNDK